MDKGNLKVFRQTFPTMSLAAFLSLLPFSLKAQEDFDDCCCCGFIPCYQTVAEFDLGYRTDSFRFETSFSTGIEDIVSKVKWSDLQIFEIAGFVKYEADCNVYIRGLADYGTIISGNNFSKEFTEISGLQYPLACYSACGDGGSVYDFSGGVGYAIKIGCECEFSLVPLVGYAYHAQCLRSKHGDQKLVNEDFPCCSDPLPGLKSRFSARWNGPWAGIDLYYKFCNWILLANGEYHWTWFDGKARWNLRTDFVKDPKQHSFGHGQVYSVEGKYVITPYWLLGLKLGYHTFKTRGGHSKLFFANETAKLKLNTVRWKSFDALFTVAYDF